MSDPWSSVRLRLFHDQGPELCAGSSDQVLLMAGKTKAENVCYAEKPIYILRKTLAGLICLNYSD